MGVNMLARRPYNVYNIFFLLERARLLQDSTRDAHDGNQQQSTFSSCCEFAGFDQLNLPELPPRYHNLQLPPDWYVPTAGKSAKRKHTATHGLKNFKKLARTVASNWKDVDTATLNYCKAVARMIKERHTELTKGGDEKHKKTLAKKNKKAATLNKKSIESNALKEATNPSVMSVNTDDITKLHAIQEPKNRSGGTNISAESTYQNQQWIDDAISMPVMSVDLADQTEEIGLHIRDIKIEEISTMPYSALGNVTPPNWDRPDNIDWWNIDDFESASIEDSILFFYD